MKGIFHDRQYYHKINRFYIILRYQCFFIITAILYLCDAGQRCFNELFKWFICKLKVWFAMPDHGIPDDIRISKYRLWQVFQISIKYDSNLSKQSKFLKSHQSIAFAQPLLNILRQLSITRSATKAKGLRSA